MVIHRVGPLPDTSPTRVDLGRVLVTIDDLSALVDIMKQEQGSASEVQIQFSGGYFTDPGDLRLLSNDELRSLKVHSSNAEVNMDQIRAVAVGTDATTARINNGWARSRQTTEGSLPQRFAFVPLGLLFAGLASIIPLRQQNIIDLNWTLILLALAFLLPTGVALYAGTVRSGHPKHGTVVVPMSLSEYRQLQASNRYPRATVVATIIGIAVGALVTITVGLLAK